MCVLMKILNTQYKAIYVLRLQYFSNNQLRIVLLLFQLGIENVPDSTPDIAPSPKPGRLYPDIAGKYLNKKGQRFPRRN